MWTLVRRTGPFFGENHENSIKNQQNISVLHKDLFTNQWYTNK